MRARDLMTRPVITVAPETPLKRIAGLLVEHGISAVPVVDAGGELVGIVSEADLLPIESVADPRTQVSPVSWPEERLRTARDVMSTEVLAAREEDDVSLVARLMIECNVRRIPILDGTRVAGIISRRDMVRLLARTDAQVAADLRAALEAEPLFPRGFRVEVAEGVATLGGLGDQAQRGLAATIAGSVPGVIGIHFA